MKHILLEKLYVYPLRSQDDVLSDFEYDNIKGYWKNKITNVPLMFEELSIGPRTKKADVETGEDRKGE